jgi:hypothetical protein
VAAPLHIQSQSVGVVIPDNSLSLLSQLMTQQGQQQQVRLPQNNTPTTEAQLQSLQAILSGQSQVSESRSPNDILREILGLSREYLDRVPSTSGTPTEESIKGLLRLLIGLATEHIRPRDPEGLAAPNPLVGLQSQWQASSTNSLLDDLSHFARQPRVEPPSTATGSSLLQQLQQQHRPQHQQQHRPPLPSQLTGQQVDLQNILAQGARSSSLSGTPLIAQFLQLQQQQQQQELQQNRGAGAGNRNPPSPPGDSCRTS